MGIIIILPIIQIGKLKLLEVIGIQVCLALSLLPFPLHHTASTQLFVHTVWW